MPWNAADAIKHSKKAKGKGSQWAAVANSVLKRSGDEGSAIRQANAVVGRSKGKLDYSKRKGKK
jgi:hypothetical protein